MRHCRTAPSEAGALVANRLARHVRQGRNCRSSCVRIGKMLPALAQFSSWLAPAGRTEIGTERALVVRNGVRVTCVRLQSQGSWNYRPHTRMLPALLDGTV